MSHISLHSASSLRQAIIILQVSQQTTPYHLLDNYYQVLYVEYEYTDNL
jgi:hypothetical protein